MKRPKLRLRWLVPLGVLGLPPLFWTMVLVLARPSGLDRKLSSNSPRRPVGRSAWDGCGSAPWVTSDSRTWRLVRPPQIMTPGSRSARRGSTPACCNAGWASGTDRGRGQRAVPQGPSSGRRVARTIRPASACVSRSRPASANPAARRSIRFRGTEPVRGADRSDRPGP